ncbi:MAG: nitrilase-related carbon-nitrogen hydrolase [Bacillota bacterium]
MSRLVRVGLIQASHEVHGDEPVEKHKEAALEKHLRLIARAAEAKAQVVCLQELFYGPYFCAEQNSKWYAATEKVPEGPTTKLMQEQAKKYGLVLVVPLYEEEITGLYYNTVAVIDADGRYLGKFRKIHLPHVQAGESQYTGFWEKYYFRPGNLGHPVFETSFARIGVYICYDRHFPEGPRILGLNGAEIVFNPSATVAGLSEHLWKLEQPAHAVANGYYVGAINRVGTEAPWNMGHFYGSSYLCDPHGQIVAEGSREDEEVVIGDADLDVIREVRNVWQFFRDRRPETYGRICTP